MGLVYKNVKPIKVYYQCDICKIGYPNIIDSDTTVDDEGNKHITYVYQCPNCGSIAELENLKFPYIDYIEYDDFVPYKV